MGERRETKLASVVLAAFLQLTDTDKIVYPASPTAATLGVMWRAAWRNMVLSMQLDAVLLVDASD